MLPKDGKSWIPSNIQKLINPCYLVFATSLLDKHWTVMMWQLRTQHCKLNKQGDSMGPLGKYQILRGGKNKQDGNAAILWVSPKCCGDLENQTFVKFLRVISRAGLALSAVALGPAPHPALQGGGSGQSQPCLHPGFEHKGEKCIHSSSQKASGSNSTKS